MSEYLSPGIFTKEVDYSEYVSDTSTCIVGCVGEAKRGPVGVPTLITSQSELITTFGTPTEGTYGIYSALEVLSQASQLYYTRVVRSATQSSAGVVGTDKVTFKSAGTGKTFNGITIDTTEPDSDGKFTVTVKDTDGATLETYADVTIADVETAINDASAYVKADVQPSGTVTVKTFTLSGAVDGGSYATTIDAADTTSHKLSFRTTYYDSTLNGGTVAISEPDVYGYFTITVSDVNGDIVETWSEVTLDQDDDRYVGYIVNSSSGRIVVTVNTDESVALKAEVLILKGGDDGVSGISNADIIGSDDDTGIYSFSNAEMLSIDVLIVPGKTDAEVINAALTVCEDRGDTIFVADTPFGLNATQVVGWSNGTGQYTDHSSFNSSYGAFYWPWVKVADSYTKSNIWLPPSGFVVAKYAFNDNVSYPWTAPAGLNRGLISDALGVEKSPTKGERDTVYGNRNIINPIANFLSEGLVIWGQKTMQRKPTALDRVNVRRTLCYLKRVIGSATRYFVFEQNNSATWEKWKSNIEPILTNVKTNGGLYEYKVSINPTDSDIENNRMPVNIYIKPTKSAEFIPITFNVMAYGATFTEN